MTQQEIETKELLLEKAASMLEYIKVENSRLSNDIDGLESFQAAHFPSIARKMQKNILNYRYYITNLTERFNKLIKQLN